MDVKSFLPPVILEKDREKPWMEWVPGAVLFADVSGFTPMSEALSVLGAEGGEILTDVLNRYFAAMIGIVHAYGGQVMKFGGDAILCFFPDAGYQMADGGNASRSTMPDERRADLQLYSRNLKSQIPDPKSQILNPQSEIPHPISDIGHPTSLPWALGAARLMQDAMPRFQNIKTHVKRFALKMKIGVAHGECLLAGVGDPAVRCDYVFAGAPVDATSDAEHHAVAGEIIFAGDESKVQSTKFKVEDIEAGFWRILDVPAEPETRSSKLETAPFAPASSFQLPASVSSYLIREVHDLVASGHKAQVGALLEIVPVFLKFTGFTYTREGFDLSSFDAFFRTVMEITERHGGRLNRISMGDKGSTALLLFGAPNPLEKKEQLACQWALDLFAAVRARFPRLTVGAGMNSGRVFTGIVGGAERWEYTVMGDAVNFAARLMQGAEAGQACASESFVRKAREVYGFDDLGTRKFKGKAEPLAVFALKERRKAGWTAGGTEQAVGRERETRTLLERLDRAWDGEPGMAVVEGEAGVGKSFLAARLLQEATRKGWRTVPAKGEITLRNHAYAPWREVASTLLFQGRDPSVEALAKVLDVEQSPFLSWFCEFLGLPVPKGTPQPAHDEETRKRLFHHHLSRLLLSCVPQTPHSPIAEPTSDIQYPISDIRYPTSDIRYPTSDIPNPISDIQHHSPVCIFLDDLHWFDTLSLEFLAALLNHLKDQRLFILAATRPDWDKKDFENRATVSILSLGELDRGGCRILAESRLGGKVRDTLADFLYNRTKGNPFFTHQLLDYLLHEDLLETRLGEWLLKRGVEQKGAMTGTEVLLAQINRLPAAEQAHLQAAACMGPTFDLAVLKAVLGRSFRRKALGSLIASGYLFEQEVQGFKGPKIGHDPSRGPDESKESRSKRCSPADSVSMGGQEQRTLKGAATLKAVDELRATSCELRSFSFPHALVQETIYQALPQRARKRLHRKIGLAMEVHHAGDLDPLYPNLANHFHLSGYRAKAVDYCILAGKRLAEQLSYPEACNFYQLAYGYLQRSSDLRKWETGLTLCEIQLKASQIQQAIVGAALLAKAARANGLRRELNKARMLEYDGMQRIGDYNFIKEANKMLQGQEIEEIADRNFLSYLIGIALWRCGAYDQAVLILGPIVAIEKAEPGLALRTFLPLAYIEQSRGNHERALTHIEAGLQLAAIENIAHQSLKLAITRGILLMESGRLQEAIDAFASLIQEVERFGDYYLMATIMLNMGDCEWRLGDYPAAERFLDEARIQFSRLGVLNGIAGCHKIKGIVHFFQERYPDAHHEYLESIRLSEKTHEMQEAWHGYYNLAEVCLKMGQIGEAREWWEKGMDSFTEKDNPGLRKMYLELEPQIR